MSGARWQPLARKDGRVPDQLADPMPARHLHERCIITGTLETRSPLAVGSGEEGPTDAPVLRDVVDGRPLLPGSSLAGVLRAGAERRADAALVARVFGGGRGDDDGGASPLLVHDAVALDDLPTTVREGVAIDPATGVAEPGKLFAREVVDRKVRFPLRLELLLERRDDDALALLVACVEDLRSGVARVGARTQRGFGKLTLVEVRARCFDLTTPAGWMAFLETPPGGPLDGPAHDRIAAAVTAAVPDRVLEAPAAMEDAVFRLKLDLTTLLVRSAPSDAAAPDSVQLRSGADPVIPGSSLAGVLRGRCLRIARLADEIIGGDRAEDRVTALFGPRLQGERDRRQLRASRVRVDDAVVSESAEAIVDRIALDRFSQKVVDGALFDEGISWGGAAAGVEVRITRPEAVDVALIALALRDLLEGDLPVGGTTGIGRGVVRGQARMTLPAALGDGERAQTVDLRPGTPAPALDRLIAALWEAS